MKKIYALLVEIQWKAAINKGGRSPLARKTIVGLDWRVAGPAGRRGPLKPEAGAEQEIVTGEFGFEGSKGG